MKKILVLMTLVSSFLFAKGADDILEDRIENELKMKNIIQISNYKVDYDVDVYGNQMNLEIEFDGVKEPKLDYNNIALEAVTTSRKVAPDLDNIYVVIKFDPVMGEDKILFSKTYSK
ncbi:MAG: hypothetical protein ACRDDH_02675 [Cetobacterium sp.]|uniref:hypothetical protein n=1 Tax=Cetobacterium sp. TaxID=2071632 RepID=UPI003EE6DB5F